MVHWSVASQTNNHSTIRQSLDLPIQHPIYPVGHWLIWQPSNPQGELTLNLPTPLPFWPLVLMAPSPSDLERHWSQQKSANLASFLYTFLYVLQISKVWKTKLWAWYFGSQIVVMFRLVTRNILFRSQLLSCQQVFYWWGGCPSTDTLSTVIMSYAIYVALL